MRKTFTVAIYFFLIIMVFPFVTKGQIFQTINDGSWSESSTWSGGNIPSHTGGLSNNSEIYINHNVILEGSFNSGQNTNSLKFYLGDSNSEAILVITGNFTIVRNIQLTIFEGATLQIGLEPEDHFYDYCFLPFSSDNLDIIAEEMSLFRIMGSNQSPRLKIHTNGTFLLYGHFLVENNFEIIVDPGGNYIVKGSFEANNNAEVKFVGAGGDIGCDMTFKNSAYIELDGGVLNVGGDLIFQNGGDIFMINGSTVDVVGMICSSPGGGNAILHITGDGSENPPNVVNYGEICETVIIQEGILPIELLYLTGQIEAEKVVISWATASEINNDYFTIERSSDLQVWEVLGYENGAGNSNMSLHYTFYDLMPVDGTAYYRLKQTDFDGQYEYFGPVSVDFSHSYDNDLFTIKKSPDYWMIFLEGDDHWYVEVYSLGGNRLFSAFAEKVLYFPSPGQAVVIRINNGQKRAFSRIIL